MTILTPAQEFKIRADEAVQALKKELGGVRANRPHAGLIEDLKASCYDQTLPIKQLGTVGVTPPREIHVQVWDQSAVASVAKAIETSSLGLTARIEGNVVRVHLPELSEERRAELARYAKQVAEQHRIKLRHLRDEANKRAQKLCDDGGVDEDKKFKLKEEIQKHTDAANKAIDEALAAKVKEINE